MGERHSDGGPSDRRVAHPASPASEGHALEARAPEATAPDVTAIEVLLAAVMRGHGTNAEAEARAVAAFRAARDSGVHAARTRRRDDWRPREQRRVGRSLKATLAVLLASLTLGGVAVAAIGSSSDDDGDDQGGSRTQPSSSAPDQSASEATEPGSGSSAPSASAQAGASAHPSQAQDTEARCRAYEEVKGRGQALNSTAWQRLVTAAGGEDKVAAYCAEQLGEDTEPTNTQSEKADSAPSTAATATDGATSSSAATAAATPRPTRTKGKQ
ncbi:hypothetical protein [Streptomyces sp. NPDC001530]|uniref:hypothetical protein n=1 Tax=Streptomyces sp. NPDC001530 TaxID=3364582 RepID=UPI0036928E86